MEWKLFINNLSAITTPLLIGLFGIFISSKLNKKQSHGLIIVGVFLLLYGLIEFVSYLLFPWFVKQLFDIDMDNYYHPTYDKGVIINNVIGMYLTVIGTIILFFGIKRLKNKR